MKIIQEGTIPPADRPWWTKQIIVCGYCKARFQLDEEDNPAHGGERHPEGEHWVQCFCPTCKKSVTAQRVVMRGASPENDQASTKMSNIQQQCWAYAIEWAKEDCKVEDKKFIEKI